MTFRNRYAPSEATKRTYSQDYLINTAGYVPIAKRIDQMVRAGIALQQMPSYYQFADGKIPEKFESFTGNPGDLYFQQERSRTLQSALATAEAIKTKNASDAALRAVKEAAVAEYLASHPVPSPDASPASPNGTVGSLKTNV